MVKKRMGGIGGGSGLGKGILEEVFRSQRFFAPCIITTAKDDNHKDGQDDGNKEEEFNIDWYPAHGEDEVPPPRSIAEIFECTGALLLYYSSHSPKPLNTKEGETEGYDDDDDDDDDGEENEIVIT